MSRLRWSHWCSVSTGLWSGAFLLQYLSDSQSIGVDEKIQGFFYIYFFFLFILSTAAELKNKIKSLVWGEIKRRFNIALIYSPSFAVGWLTWWQLCCGERTDKTVELQHWSFQVHFHVDSNALFIFFPLNGICIDSVRHSFLSQAIVRKLLWSWINVGEE